MRDVLLTLFIFSTLPLIFRKPFYGLVMFTWLAYMRAPDLCWGFATALRFSLMVALIMFAGFFLFERKRFYVPDIRNHLLTALTVLVIISVIVNYFMINMAFGAYEDFVKIILVSIWTVTIVDSLWKLRVLVWTVALSLGFYGFKGGIFGFLGGETYQGPGGLLLDNNDFSLAMVMNIPFLFFLSMEEKNPNVKLFLRVVALLTVATVVSTHSRGGFLALCMVYFVITMKSRYKLLGLSAAVVAAILFIIFIPPEYVERLRTITDVKESSAASRIIAWQTALNMIQDNPIFGVGLGNFFYNYVQYCPIEIKTLYGANLVPHVAHNSYLQVWAECGTFAFIIFVGVIFVTLHRLRKLRKVNRRAGGPTWVEHYSHAFETSIYGYLVGATFLNRAMFDLVYLIIGMCAAMEILAVRARDTEVAEEGPPKLTIRSRDGFILPRNST
jgi:probable O-glycosylation ligase (exosortase A-associated)